MYAHDASHPQGDRCWTGRPGTALPALDGEVPAREGSEGRRA